MTSETHFDLKTLNKCLEACLEGEDVQLKPFLEAFQELNKFCELMGGILFNAVSSEILSKSKILQDLIDKDESTFSSLNSMIDYERGKKHLNNGVCGCRTLLRLIWGLDFVRTFFNKAFQLDMDETTCGAGREAYELTLAKHHGWFVRQGAYICLWSLPTKKSLLLQLFGQDYNESVEFIPTLLKTANAVYDHMHKIYETNQLLKLP